MMDDIQQHLQQHPHQDSEKRWIRGVNIGGFLVMERYLTPYSFAVTDCHVQGDLCWYPGQIDAPPKHKNNSQNRACDISACNAILSKNAFGDIDYPMDEWSLGLAFESNRTAGEQWFNSHFEHFLKREDLVRIHQAGITHVRVPLPHWILGDVREDEQWIVGDRWKYFKRMCEWAREIGLQVWPNIHTAPGSQNGFDNSGVQNSVKTCGGWTDNPKAMQRSLDVLLEVATKIKQDNLTDVITGFGLLNEPFGDCNHFKYQQFLENGLRIIRSVLGPDIGVFMSDLFGAPLFNDGEWGLDPVKWNNTFLDSHYYNVFDTKSRGLSPKEHVKTVCHPTWGHNVKDCCFEDPPTNSVPSRGVQRIVTEWSAAFDSMPGQELQVIMKGIHDNGVQPIFDRQLSPERQEFLTNFIQSQIVEYEAADIGIAQGWFYWTLKTEGGAYAEWDFLRGLDEGWFPIIAPPDVPSETIYGSCDEIYNRTTNSTSIVHEFPSENFLNKVYWEGSLANETISLGTPDHQHRSHSFGGGLNFGNSSSINHHQVHWLLMAGLVVVAVFGWRSRKKCSRKKLEYTEIIET